MANVSKDLGPVSAYAVAVAHGFKGTEEEWAVLQMQSGANAQRAETAAGNAEAAAQGAGTQATNAANSAENASKSAQNAGTQATNAANSASAAAKSAADAKTNVDNATADAKASAQKSANASEASALRSESAAERAEEAAEKLESASQIDDSIASFEKVWSSRRTVERLCPAFEKSGSVVSCYPVEGYPLGVRSRIEAVQEGSGDPSPENVRLISGWNAATLTRCGKNLFDNNPELLEYVTYKNKTGTESTKCGYKLNLPVGVYTLSGNLIADTPGDFVYTYVLDDDGVVVAGGTGNDAYFITPDKITTKQVTIDRPRHSLFVCNAVTSGTKEGTAELFRRYNIMLNVGDTTSHFEPYRGDAYAVSFGETVYGGVMDWSSGELKVTDGLASGSEAAWSEYGSYAYGKRFVTNKFDAQPDDTSEGLRSNVVPVITAKQESEYAGKTYLRVDKGKGKSSLFVAQSDIGAGVEITADSVKKWLGDMDAYFVYPLAQPYAIQLDPQAVPALMGPNNLWSDTGETAVSGRTDPVHVMETMQERLAALENAVINNI